MLVAWLERGQNLYQNVGRMLEYDREPGANILRYDHHGRRQAELLGPPGKLAVIKGCDAVARLVAGVVQRVREIDARLAVGERPERVNDFAAPFVMNLLCKSLAYSGRQSPMAVG